MQPDWISLSVGLGGLIVGAWGMWLTYAARASAFQQTLHEKQVDVALDLMSAVNVFTSDFVPASQEPAQAARWAPRIDKAIYEILLYYFVMRHCFPIQS